MRLFCSSTATTSSTDVSMTRSCLRRSNTGQISRVFLADVPFVQRSCRFRRRDDAKTRLLHRRHTWTSDCHHTFPLFTYWDLYSIPLHSGYPTTQKSSISRRTSSGSTSIVTTWPTLRQISQQSFRDDAKQKMYVDHDCLPSASLHNTDPLG